MSGTAWLPTMAAVREIDHEAALEEYEADKASHAAWQRFQDEVITPLIEADVRSAVGK